MRLAREEAERKRLEEERRRAEEARKRAEEKARQEAARLAELKKQRAIRQMGLCPASFAWRKIPGGYRCEGGTHYITDEQVEENMQAFD